MRRFTRQSWRHSGTDEQRSAIRTRHVFRRTVCSSFATFVVCTTAAYGPRLTLSLAATPSPRAIPNRLLHRPSNVGAYVTKLIRLRKPYVVASGSARMSYVNLLKRALHVILGISLCTVDARHQGCERFLRRGSRGRPQKRTGRVLGPGVRHAALIQ